MTLQGLRTDPDSDSDYDYSDRQDFYRVAKRYAMGMRWYTMRMTSDIIHTEWKWLTDNAYRMKMISGEYTSNAIYEEWLVVNVILPGNGDKCIISMRK